MSFPNLSALAVRESALTLFFLILSVAIGVYSFLSLGRAEDPAFTVRVMMVSVLWPGSTTGELEQQVVHRLEKRIQEVDSIRNIETTIRPGRADMQVVFEDFTPSQRIPDLFYQVRKRMQEEVPYMPSGVIGPIVNDDFGDLYFTMISLTAPGLPMRELTREAEAIRDRLQMVAGVRRAQILGERAERMYVDFDTAKLANLGIGPEVVFAAIEAHNQLAPAGQLETEGARVYLRVNNNLTDPNELAAVPVRIGERLLRLGDLATIHRGYEDPPSYLIRTGGIDTLLLGVVMRNGENGLDLGARLTDFLAAEQARLPLGMSLTPVTNQAELISAAVNLFQIKFLVAVVVVMAVSILAIGLRAGLVVGIAIPITLGLTFTVMQLLGINLDRITLGALVIALGLLVDDAIIAIEMMIVKMQEGWERVRSASHAWNVTAAPMLFGTLVTVAGFTPIGFARSSVGEYAGDIFWVLAISLLVSWVVAVIFIPYLGVMLLPNPEVSQAGDQYQTPRYRQLRELVQWCVRRRKTVVAATMGLLAIAIVAMATLVEQQFFPNSDRHEVLVSVYHPQGTAIANTDATVRRLEKILLPIPEAESVTAFVGAGMPRFFASANPENPDPAFAKLLVMAKSADDRTAIMAELERHIKAGAFPEALVRYEILFNGPPVSFPVSFRVLGPDSMELRRISHEIQDIMSAHPNIRDPHLEWDGRVPVLHFAMDPQRLRLMGLTPAEVGRQLQFQLDGVTVTRLREDIRSVELRARGGGDPGERFAGLEIRTQEGNKVPLAQLGRIETRFEDSLIKRYNREPFLAVHADVVNAQPPDVSAALWQQLEPLRQSLPEGYRIDIGGVVEESGKADAAINKMVPLMIGLMLVFTMLQMRSFSGTFMVVATAPLGVIGAVLAMILFDQAFGFVALLGLIGLAGILMRNTLILTQQVSDNLETGMPPLEAVVEAAVHRARPVILTALAAILAFVPLTLDTFWGPMAFVLIGGVAVGTAITLLFVPALYALWFRLGKT
ncbi:MAG: multidrug transporter [Gammaproteobacteria bacterium BRH_c0]|nr:MAG: multidrug transporter [Gammaproteobacteria bacterium BRH_c0]